MAGLLHGEERNRPIKAGDQIFTRREKYCALHGWLDLFITGGREGWISKHQMCNCKPRNGASVKALVEELKVMKKAA